MRLTPAEQRAIESAAKEAFPPGTRVSLFGSRTDNQRRGGDIDLLVETIGELTAAEWIDRRSRFAARVYRLLDEQHIDILTTPLGVPDPRGVVQTARLQGIELVRT